MPFSPVWSKPNAQGATSGDRAPSGIVKA